MDSLNSFVVPSLGSTAAFVGIVACVCGAWIWAVRRAWPERANGMTVRAVVALAACLGSTTALAVGGVFARLAGSPAVMTYLLVCNVVAIGLAVSAVGRRFAEAIPIAALVGIQAFRLPLELVLHSWYEQGTLPIQMTFSGANWDIVTGSLALLGGLALTRADRRSQWRLAALFNVVGFGLLMRVMWIAGRSLPSPLRAFPEDPPVLLPFFAPYTWIVPICVSGALFAHLVVGRWLWNNRAVAGVNVASSRALI